MSRPKRGKRIALLAGCVVVVVLVAAGWIYREHIRFAWLFEPVGENDQGYPEYRHKRTGIVFVQLPGSAFMMGSPASEPYRRNDELQHEVTLSPFLIGKYETTQMQWKRVMDSNPSEFAGDRLPVENVSWHDCQTFCEETSLCLPSEAQWEYSCRAGKKGPIAGTGIIDEMVWYDKNSGGTTHAVGKKKPNDFGLYDMQGNVYEWCEDVYDKEFYSKPEATGPDPICKSGSGSRVDRGGCGWRSDAATCRSAFRRRGIPSTRASHIGFRPVFFPLPD